MLNKNFVIPERRFLSKLASEVYTAKKESLIQSIKEVKTIKVTTDCWNSKQNFSYISATAHFIDSKFNIKSRCLAVRHIN